MLNKKTIKGFSLWQPWASLMQVGAKTIETRSWSTQYRGPLLICSAKGGLSKKELVEQMSQFSFTEQLYSLVKNELHHRYTEDLLFPEVRDRIIEVLPRGKALCVVDLIDVVPVESLLNNNEIQFGDYTPGRFVWITKNCRPIEPISITGRQRLFNIPAEITEKLKPLKS